MSAGSHAYPKPPRAPDVLGELLHSLSQPLTGLRCSLELSLQLPLELSLEQIAERQQESVAAALQQTEKVVGMIQLMREYLDAEQPVPDAYAAALAPALRSVVEELSTIAAASGVQLLLVGTCAATLPVPKSRLRLALQYLITTMIEAQPEGGKVILLLGEDPSGAALRVEGERPSRDPNSRQGELSAAGSPTKHDPAEAVSTLRRVRLAIASRVLEAAGASLAFGAGDAGPTGFVLRIPRRVGASA